VGDGTLNNRVDTKNEVDQLRGEIDELRNIVSSLLNVILEEADGPSSGSAPKLPAHPRVGYCM